MRLKLLAGFFFAMVNLPTLSFAGLSANAGLDIVASTGASATLDGSASATGRGYTYQWTFSGKPYGSQAVITSPTSMVASVTPDLPGRYTLVLTVSDSKGHSAADAKAVFAGDADVIRGNTTWTLAGSPYTLVKDVFVDYGVTLTVEPGVVINGNGHAVRTWGQLNAIGTSSANIVFNDVHNLPGANDYYIDGRMYTINVQYAQINGGSIHYSTGDAMYGNLQLRDSVVKDARGIYFWNPLGDNFVERNVIIGTPITAAVGIPNRVFITNNAFSTSAASPGFYGVAVTASGDANNMVITKNSFLNTAVTALSLPDGYSTGKITATDNYWGTTDTAVIDGMIHDRYDSPTSADYVNYTPVLNAPDPASPDPTPYL